MHHYCFRREFLRDAGLKRNIPKAFSVNSIMEQSRVASRKGNIRMKDIADSAPEGPYPAISQVPPRAADMPTLDSEIRVPASEVPAPAPQTFHPSSDVSHPASHVSNPARGVFNPALRNPVPPSDIHDVAPDSFDPASDVVHPASRTPAREVLDPAFDVLDSCSDVLDCALYVLHPDADVPHPATSHASVSASSSYCNGYDETELKQPVSNCSAHPIRVQRFYSDNEVTLGQRSDLSCSEGSAQPGYNKKADYDFYLAVAEKDLETFGLPFATMVESRMGMRPCLTLRDIVPGTALYETMAKTLETRCNGKVVFVLSKYFNESDECQFLVHFAKTLDPYAKQQKLIPLVIDKGVPLPRVLEGLVCINYNAALRENWLGKRLWDAVHGGSGGTGGSDGSDQRTNRHRRRTLSSPFPF